MTIERAFSRGARGACPSHEVVNTPAFGPVADRMHFSQGVKAGGLLFCSGVIDTGADDRVPGDLQAEFRTAFEGVKACPVKRVYPRWTSLR